MPIKVKCQECSQVMAVPDKAAGRAVKCKACGARVAVPAAGAAGGAPRKKKKKRKKRPAPAAEPSFDELGDPGDMFSGLDLGRAEDQRERVCPSCTKPVDDEDIECPYCGVNIETGVLSVQQRERRARKGPPPEEFYGKVLGNSWKFMMAHKGFVFKTGFLWGVSATMVIVAAFILGWYTRTRAEFLRETAEGDVTFTESYVLIKPVKDTGKAEYDGVKYGPGSTRLINGELRLPIPEVAAWLSPPTYFWSFIFLVFALSFGGWAWVLADKVVEVTVAKQKKIKRFQGDMFANMTKGFTTLAWPFILMYPVCWVPALVGLTGSQTGVVISILVILLLPYFLFLPNALVHMSKPYSYRAWLINWIGKDFFNTLIPSLYTSFLFFVLVLMLPLGIALGVALNWDSFVDFYINTAEGSWLNGVTGYSAESDANSTWSMTFSRLPFLFTMSLISCTLFFTLLAFPAVMMMRVFGLFALYFQEDMDICVEQVPNSPVSFGPRFLAMQVDGILINLIGLVAYVAATMLSKLFVFLYGNAEIGPPIAIGGGLLGAFVGCGIYFANWESGSGRATLGKWSFGMMVLQENNDPMPFNMAFNRFLAALITPLTAGLAFLMVLFTPNYRAIHDSMTKTKVVWRGDEDM
ncbi:MAG: RDD family protein [Planctomycetaceae bacterium]|nr:RDD family protein [Planctomycetaceae bacterium]